MDERIKEKAKSLVGVTYLEWQKIKIVIDESFEYKKREFDRQLELSSDDINFRYLL